MREIRKLLNQLRGPLSARDLDLCTEDSTRHLSENGYNESNIDEAFALHQQDGGPCDTLREGDILLRLDRARWRLRFLNSDSALTAGA